ncbi:hypothetical protein TNCV_3520471 [Trichonephila clavipes]|nr:hypothetical protein TNCV_3520471 [Trichonephila clavipes]
MLQVEALIFNALNSHPECYSEVKNLAFGVLTICRSTYSCEQALSCVNIIKSKKDHQIGTSVHAPQRPMVTCIMMGTVVPGPHGLLCH